MPTEQTTKMHSGLNFKPTALIVPILSAELYVATSLLMVFLGSPFSVAAQQFQSEGGETEEKIQFFSK